MSEEIDDMQIDKANLFREENYTDLKVGALKVLMPVKADGSPDPDRKAQYMGTTNVMTHMGAVPIDAPIEADDLEAAIDKFPEAVNAAVEAMVERAREMQREEANKIVVPGMGGPPNISLR
ncbi:MAG: hypothetical protein ACI9QL_004169 [Candidatus Omnitrophota bacterium]|jgi:hypothetical protein